MNIIILCSLIIEGFPNKTLIYLEGKGHRVVLTSAHTAVVQGVVFGGDGCVSAHGDIRKQGTGTVVNKKSGCSNG